MKKVITTIMIMTVIILLSACGNESATTKAEKPEDVSQEMFDLANQVLEISQQYIDGEVTSGSAYQDLKEKYEQSRKILKETQSDYHLDSIISADISFLVNSVYDDNSTETVDYLDKLKKALTPIDYDNLKLSDVLVDSHWKMQHESGAYIDMVFDLNKYYALLVMPKGTTSKFDSYYRIDDENNTIISSSEPDGEGHVWAEVTSFTPSTFEYQLIQVGGKKGMKGKATKLDD